MATPKKTKKEKLREMAEEFKNEALLGTTCVEEYDALVRQFVGKLKRFANTLKD